MKRSGICCGGNWVVDEIKIIEAWPEEERLVTILSEEKGTGGAPYNVLIDLRNIDSKIYLEAVGVIGKDENGKKILSDIKNYRLNPVKIEQTDILPTSRTYVMTVAKTGRRTFFHNRGTNVLLDIHHFDFKRIRAEILHIGYALLLDKLDLPDKTFGTRMARLLSKAKNNGLKTSLDVVSENNPAKFQNIVIPSLKFTDYLIINELEASLITGINLTHTLNPEHYRKASKVLFKMGVNSIVVIHRPEAAYGFLSSGDIFIQPSHKVPENFVKGTVGAGDAFSAAILYSITKRWHLSKALKIAVATAALSLSSASATGGVPSFSSILKFSEKTPYKRI